MKHVFVVIAFLSLWWNFIESSLPRSPGKLRRSEQKCMEYKSAVIFSQSFGSLSLGSTSFSIETNKCDYSSGLITGGEVATPGEFAHMAAIGWKTLDGNVEFSCAGSLISDQFVLTVAHCGMKNRLKPSVVRLGDHDLGRSDDDTNPEEYGIKKFIKHNGYESRTRANDIALIKLDRTVIFTTFIRPACLQHKWNFGKKVNATGWGKTSHMGESSDKLMKVTLDVVKPAECLNRARDDLQIDKLLVSQICAGGGTEGKDTCQGDSGGPIQVSREDVKCMYNIVGLTSYGAFCGGNVPSIYTRVTYYLKWIEDNVWP